MLPYDCHLYRRCFIAVYTDIVFIDVVSANMKHSKTWLRITIFHLNLDQNMGWVSQFS